MDMIVKSESLTSVANAIREKGKTTDQFVFPDGFATAIMAIQSGGVHPQLVVTAPEGSTITAVNGEDTVTGVIGAEGTLTLDLPSFGTWTVMATLDGMESSTSIEVVQEYPVELDYITVCTVNGGYGELVTISGDGMTPVSVELSSTGTDAGTGTVSVSGAKEKTLTFTGGTSGYVKSVEVGNADEITVNVYPDGALYWYGREFSNITGGWKALPFTGTTSGGTYVAGTITKGANSVQLKTNGNIKSNTALITTNKVDLSKYTKMYIKVTDFTDYASNTNNWHGSHLFVTSSYDSETDYSASLAGVKIRNTGLHYADFDGKNLDGNYYVKADCYGSTMTYTEVYLVE